jgi:CDGSH-type Zn-finger protein
MENAEVKITAIPNGPLMVEGTVLVKKPDGTEETKGPKFHLCRCGHSANKPFCDGEHKKIGFIG